MIGDDMDPRKSFLASGQHEGNTSPLESYPLPVPEEFQTYIKTQYPQGIFIKVEAKKDVGYQPVVSQGELLSQYEETLKKRLNQLLKLMKLYNQRLPQIFTLIVTTDPEKTQENVAACDINSKTVFIHPYFFYLTPQEEMKAAIEQLTEEASRKGRTPTQDERKRKVKKAIEDWQKILGEQFQLEILYHVLISCTAKAEQNIRSPMDNTIEFARFLKTTNKYIICPWNMLTDAGYDRHEDAKTLLDDSYHQMDEAAKILQSRKREGTVKPIVVWLFFATYNEKARLLPRTETNIHGEDALRVKIEQLENLFKNYKDVLDWRLVVADNRSHDGTLEVAESILQDCCTHSKGKVILYQVPHFAPPMKKGGTLLYAMQHVLDKYSPKEEDVFGYTDADTTVRLDLLGLLIKPLVENSLTVAVGSRTIEGAVSVPGVNPNDPERIVANRMASVREVIRTLLLEGKLGDTCIEAPRKVKDTQCGFKLYPLKVIKEVILQYAQDYGWAFDTEWLALALFVGYTLKEIPVYWADSRVLSHTAPEMRKEMIEDWLCQFFRLYVDRKIAHMLGYTFP